MNYITNLDSYNNNNNSNGRINKNFNPTQKNSKLRSYNDYLSSKESKADTSCPFQVLGIQQMSSSNDNKTIGKDLTVYCVIESVPETNSNNSSGNNSTISSENSNFSTTNINEQKFHKRVRDWLNTWSLEDLFFTKLEFKDSRLIDDPHNSFTFREEEKKELLSKRRL